MSFKSLVFLPFLLAVLTLHWNLPRPRQRQVLLLTASYVFYGWWDWRFCSLLLFSSLLDYFCGLALSRDGWSSPRARKFVLAVSLAVNFSLLGLFKYFNFFADSLARLLNAAGVSASWPTLNIILPVGISFYTFQTVGYTLDVYHRRLPPCRDWLRFLLYVSFFPQLVAGPIERAGNLLPQLSGDRRFDPDLARQGLRHILWGYFLKCVVADNLAPLVDHLYANASSASGLEHLFGAYCFSFQIYGDFAGYSHIAIGAAALFGVRLMQNFRSPFLAQDMRELWGRWHISLSTWFRDYVYIDALGGNRAPPARRVLNVLLTFALSGLWHGARWTFVSWGLLNGVLYHLKRPFRGVSPAAATANAVVTFHLFALGMIFFRSGDLGQAVEILRRLVSAFVPGPSPLLSMADHLPPAAGMLLVVAAESFQRRRADVLSVLSFPPSLRFGLAYLLLALLFLTGNFNHVPFIYFQF